MWQTETIGKLPVFPFPHIVTQTYSNAHARYVCQWLSSSSWVMLPFLRLQHQLRNRTQSANLL